MVDILKTFWQKKKKSVWRENRTSVPPPRIGVHNYLPLSTTLISNGSLKKEDSFKWKIEFQFELNGLLQKLKSQNSCAKFTSKVFT